MVMFSSRILPAIADDIDDIARLCCGNKAVENQEGFLIELCVVMSENRRYSRSEASHSTFSFRKILTSCISAINKSLAAVCLVHGEQSTHLRFHFLLTVMKCSTINSLRSLMMFHMASLMGLQSSITMLRGMSHRKNSSSSHSSSYIEMRAEKSCEEATSN